MAQNYKDVVDPAVVVYIMMEAWLVELFKKPEDSDTYVTADAGAGVVHQVNNFCKCEIYSRNKSVYFQIMDSIWR